MALQLGVRGPPKLEPGKIPEKAGHQPWSGLPPEAFGVPVPDTLE